MKQERGISRYLYTLLFFLLAVTVVTITGSCGSGGGNSGGGGGNSGGGNGSGSGGGGTTPLATGAFTKTVDMGSGNYTGLLDTDPYAHYQYLYLAGNINGAGRITGLAIKYRADVATAVTCPNSTIKLSHSNLANLTGTFASNLGTGQGSQTTALNSATMTFPAGAAGSWQTISLATPFNYNGKDNLIVDVERTGACSGIVFDSVNTAWPYTAGVWTTTNGSATGTTATWAANGRLVFAGGDDAPFAVGGQNTQIPFTSDPATQRTQNLYLPTDINGAGPITGVGMEIGALTTAQTYTVTVKLGHATVNNLAANYDANYSGSPTTVANAVTFTVPAGVPAGSYVWIPLTGSFNYNGTNNLLLELIVSSATGGMNYTHHNHGSGNIRLIYGPNNASATTFLDFAIQHAKFRFNGGTMDILNGGSTGEAAYFDSSNNGRAQYLLLASELGTSGNITSFACRANNPNAAALNYTNTIVILAHTANKSLSSTFADNVSGGVTVFSGTYTMPGNILEGDYFKILFSTPFTYNGRDNLVVSIQSDADAAGVTGVNCKLATDAVRFADQRVSTINYANAAGSLSNNKPNVSITYSK